jgi:hypothetical protein
MSVLDSPFGGFSVQLDFAVIRYELDRVGAIGTIWFGHVHLAGRGR